MRYIGEIHRLFEMISEKEQLTTEQMIDKIYEIMSKDKEERTMLVCDEAYLLIDTQVPQSLIFLRNIAKRCRKYERKSYNNFTLNY